jgi:glutamine synthetase
MQDLHETDEIGYVLNSAYNADVKFIRLWFADIEGILKGVAITVEELEEALRRGVGFDGSSIHGFARSDESDMVAFPDRNTFRIVPWRPKEHAVARMFCDILTPNMDPFTGDSRFILQRMIEKVKNLGFQFYVAPELEFFYFYNQKSLQPLDEGSYFEQSPGDLATELRRQTVLSLADMGIPVKHSHHEAAPSQHEIDFQHTDALTMADSLMTARLLIKEIASNNDVYATFMPKPISGQNGSGLHINMSLFQGETNVFYDAKDPYKLSKMAKGFLAGLIFHAREMTVVTNQWVNSYKRLIPGFEAPVRISWARVNRGDLIRIPAFKVGREDSVRIEYRAADSALNPYLGFAVLLAAGLDGIEKGYDLPDPADSISDGSKIPSLPTTLEEAIQAAEESQFLHECLGKEALQILLANKRRECFEYRSQVTDYEIKRYFHLL